jgi:hypothetical protein
LRIVASGGGEYINFEACAFVKGFMQSFIPDILVVDKEQLARGTDDFVYAFGQINRIRIVLCGLREEHCASICFGEGECREIVEGQ